MELWPGGAHSLFSAATFDLMTCTLSPSELSCSVLCRPTGALQNMFFMSLSLFPLAIFPLTLALLHRVEVLKQTSAEMLC